MHTIFTAVTIVGQFNFFLLNESGKTPKVMVKLIVVPTCIAEATATIQKLNSDNASGASAAVGAAEAESRQLKEQLAILHKVVAGMLIICLSIQKSLSVLNIYCYFYLSCLNCFESFSASSCPTIFSCSIFQFVVDSLLRSVQI